MFEQICQKINYFWPTESNVSYFFLGLAVLAVVMAGINKTWSRLAKITSLILTLWICILGLFTSWIFLEAMDDPVAMRYFDLNAAIKNTCYLDLAKRNCPQNLDQLIRIEEDRFGSLLAGKKVQFKYYPEMDKYSLLIGHNRYKGVLFDPRLAGNGYPDFLDVKLDCRGRIAGPLIEEEPWMGGWVKYKAIYDY